MTTTSTPVSTAPVELHSSSTDTEEGILTKIPRSVHKGYLQQTVRLASQSPPKPTNFRVGCVIVAFSQSDINNIAADYDKSPLSNEVVSPASPIPIGTVLATGYTLELPGNTHAEQCALAKLVDLRHRHQRNLHLRDNNIVDKTTGDIDNNIDANPPLSSLTNLFDFVIESSPEDLSEKSEKTTTSTAASASEVVIVLYTSLEPCSLRLSGAVPCVERIIATTTKTTTTTATDPSQTQRGASVKGIDKVIFGAKEPGTFVRDSRTCHILDEANVAWDYIPDFEQVILEVAMAGHIVSDTNSGNTAGDTAESKTPQQQGGESSSTATAAAAGEAGADAPGGESKEEQEERRKKEVAEQQPRNPKKRMMEYNPADDNIGAS